MELSDLPVLPQPHPQQLSCFVCDEKVTSTSIPVISGCTQHSKTDFPKQIEQVMGEDFVVVVAEEDFICERCSQLLNLFDKLQCDLNNVRMELKGFLNAKYQLVDSTYEEAQNLSEQILENGPTDNILNSHQIKLEPPDTFDEPSAVRLYKCQYCSYVTKTRIVLMNHLRSHHKKIVYKCSICRMSFDSRLDIEKHITFEHGSVSSSSSSRPQKSKISEHNKTNSIRRTFKCGLCFSTYGTKDELIDHFDSHDTSKSITSTGRTFNSLTDSDDILGNTNTNKFKKSRKVDEGFFSIFNESDAEQVSSISTPVVEGDHIQGYVDVEDVLGKLHSGTVTFQDNQHVQMEQCKKTNNIHIKTDGTQYVSSDLLEELQGQFHIVEETTDQQYILNSDIIGYNDMSPSGNVDQTKQPKINVQIKMKPQNESIKQKIYVCSLCKLRSSSELRMKRHIKGHIALSRKVHTCHICAKVLTTGSNLKRHIKKHISDPVACEICFELLTDRLHLKQHLETLHPQSYTCSVCGETVLTKQLLRNHELMHKNITHFTCPDPECSDVGLFLTEVELKNHQCTAHGIVHEFLGSRMYRCYICSKILTTYHNLKRHLLTHKSSNSETIRCSVCQEELSSKLDLKAHYEEKHPEVYQCGFCSEVFTNKKNCKSHEETHPERLFYKCREESCGKVFPNERRLKRHVDITHREPRCRFCSKEINNMKKLIEHEKRHEKFKHQYPCTTCNKVFQTPSGLRYHLSVHTGKYKFHCDICKRGFNSEVVMKEHKASHTKEIRYTCDRCGRNFSANSTYRLHRIWHDNPFPYTCNICNRKFRHTSILAVHKRRAHTGERPYKCPHCPFTFNISSTLNKHLILHTKKYPYICQVCSKGFTTRTKIAKHMEKAHQDPTMVNQKPKPCEYKMVLRPEEYDENTITPELVEHELEGEDSHQGSERIQHINVVQIPPGHPMFNLFQ